MNLLEDRAEDLMTRQVVTIEPERTVRAAAARMSEHGVHCLVVPVEGEGRAVGVITMKDVIQLLCEGQAEDLDELLVRDVATQPAIALPAGLCLLDCIRFMRMNGVRSAPVLSEGRVIGLLSFTDVLDRLAAA